MRKQNVVQEAIIYNFVTQFGNGGAVIFLRNPAKPDAPFDNKKLRELGIPFESQNQLPDVIIHDEKKNRLFLIDIAGSQKGPVTTKRRNELSEFFTDCKEMKIYISAYVDMKEFSEDSNQIAWETEVWLADTPDHMIHFNGDKFLGPR